MRSALVALLALGAAAALAGCGQGAPAPASDVRPVQTMVVEHKPTSLGATYSGVIAARTSSNQGFRVTGTVARRLVEVGDHVKAGQGLLQLDPTSLDLNQQAAKAQLDAAHSKAAQAKVNLDRDAALLKQGFISQAEYDRDRVDLDTATSQRQMARAQYDEATNQVGYGTLRAAVTGIVTAIKVDVGQVVSAGATAVTIAKDGDREAVISVPESRIDQLRDAKDLYVTLWADPARRYRGRLRRIDPSADPSTRTYDAYVTLLDPDAAVLLGMTAFVHLPEIRGGDSFALPLTAVVEKPNGSWVWKVDKASSTVALQRVTLLTVRGNDVLVSGGLQNGEVVVTAGASLLHAGQKVRAVGKYSDRDS